MNARCGIRTQKIPDYKRTYCLFGHPLSNAFLQDVDLFANILHNLGGMVYRVQFVVPRNHATKASEQYPIHYLPSPQFRLINEDKKTN